MDVGLVSQVSKGKIRTPPQDVGHGPRSPGAEMRYQKDEKEVGQLQPGQGPDLAETRSRQETGCLP